MQALFYSSHEPVAFICSFFGPQGMLKLVTEYCWQALHQIAMANPRIEPLLMICTLPAF